VHVPQVSNGLIVYRYEPKPAVATNADIYVANPDGSNPTQLTNDAGFEAFPLWTPDGQQILFSSSSSNGLKRGVYMVNADGSNLHQVFDGPADLESLVWSPDGTKGAFHVEFQERDYVDEFSATFSIYTMNADGSNVQRLTYTSDFSAVWPSWSPDGKHIAFAARVEDGDGLHIYVMNVDGSDQRQLTYGATFDQITRWTPDGEHILFTSTGRSGREEHADNRYIYSMDLNGTNIHRFFDRPVEAGDEYWEAFRDVSPDGQYTFLFVIHNKKSSLSIVDLTNANLVYTFENTTQTIWSPDGKQIRYFNRDDNTPHFMSVSETGLALNGGLQFSAIRTWQPVWK
jgi:Tol biopolymer transport system component